MKHQLIGPEFSFQYQKNELCVEGIQVSEIVKKYGSPLYIYSGSAIRESYQRLNSALKGLPVQICYAVKANSNIHILNLLGQLGAGCDLVSYGEWYRAELAKIPRQKRVLSGVAKTNAELELLFKLQNAGVGSIHVESMMEFELLIKLANKNQKPVKVALRYNPDVDAKTLDKISTGRKKDKFGLNISEILFLAKKYKQDSFLKIDGISIHIGSQITQLGPYEKAFKGLKDLCAKVEAILERPLAYVDLGGGLGVQYLNEKTIDLNQYAKLVKKYFSNYPKILIEPGRSLIANAGILVSEVVFNKTRKENRTLILDAGMNDLVRPALYEAYHHILPLKKTKLKVQAWDVVGGICESTDYFAKNRKLAIHGEPGEQLAFLSAGAYGFSMSSTYNTRPRVAEVLVDQGKVRLIRKRENLRDLIKAELGLFHP